MTQYTKRISILLCTAVICSSIHVRGTIDSVTGDTGSAQTGAITISGGSSGVIFNSTSSTITQSFDFISLPFSSSTSGQIIQGGDPVYHKYPNGNANIFWGAFAGNFSISGANNTGYGDLCLNVLTSGSSNTAVGYGSLIAVEDGSFNIGIGYSSGSGVSSGSSNILIGNGAGSAYTTETNNIILGAHTGAANESLTIRIGDGQTQQNCYIDGIYASDTNLETALEVIIDDQGKLATFSNIVNRVSFNISTINTEADAILKLNPVIAKHKNKASKKKQFAFIDDEVQKVLPSLVVSDKKGNPLGIKYRELSMLLLAQLQKQNARIQALENKIQKLLDKVLP